MKQIIVLFSVVTLLGLAACSGGGVRVSDCYGSGRPGCEKYGPIHRVKVKAKAAQ